MSYPTKIITPFSIIFDGEVDIITLPGSEGEMGLKIGHEDIVSNLVDGFIFIDEKKYCYIESGILWANPSICTVLIEKFTLSL
jgi:F-type H+-transporting ATPase subunit epsilon